MADYWKSNPKKYCEICKCWIQDNVISVKNHEGGQRHINNVKKKLRELQNNSKASSENKIKEKISLINDMAYVGMVKDLERDPSLAKRYGADVPELKAADKKEKKADANGKQKAKSKAPTSAIPPAVAISKPVCFEWKELKAEDGRLYYWNKKTGTTQWERPKASIEPINDSLCVSKEKDRLNQFLFHRLVDLSESGNPVASEAVCRAFGASTAEKSKPPSEIKIDDIPLPPQPSNSQGNLTDFGPSEEKRPRINLLGEWKPVTPPKPQKEEIIPEELFQEVQEEPESLIKQRITTVARKNLKYDQSKLEEIAQKAEILSHLSEINEAGLRSDRKIIFEEKQATVSAAARKEAHKVLLSFKHDPLVKTESPESTAPVISFKRKVGANRSLRSRRDND
ncbi:hypothetical protein Aperf_G00000042535 [Anoplocephala perfoliata]